jgi:hypothetical protein
MPFGASEKTRRKERRGMREGRESSLTVSLSD